jgi:hypothetical protein
MSANVKVVEQKPELSQEAYPVLPETPREHLFIGFGAPVPYNQAEMEWAFAAYVNSCILAGKWAAVDTYTYLVIAQDLCMPFPVSKVTNAVWELVEKEQVEILSVQDKQYLVFSPEWAKTMMSASAPRIRKMDLSKRLLSKNI